MIDVLKDGAAGLSGYGNAWGHLDRGKMYVKIDDDVVCAFNHRYLMDILDSTFATNKHVCIGMVR